MGPEEDHEAPHAAKIWKPAITDGGWRLWDRPVLLLAAALVPGPSPALSAGSTRMA